MKMVPNNHTPDDLTEFLLHYGEKILQQIEGIQLIGIVNRSLLALVYLKNGDGMKRSRSEKRLIMRRLQKEGW